jgi:hypothetical protein
MVVVRNNRWLPSLPMSISFAPAVSPGYTVEFVVGRMLDIVGIFVWMTVGKNAGEAVVLWTGFVVIAVGRGRMGVGSSVAVVGKLVAKSDTVGIEVGKSVGIGVLAAIGFKVFGFLSEVGWLARLGRSGAASDVGVKVSGSFLGVDANVKLMADMVVFSLASCFEANSGVTTAVKVLSVCQSVDVLSTTRTKIMAATADRNTWR